MAVPLTHSLHAPCPPRFTPTRMTKLLAAKDKKQMILDMAAANEIDQSLMDLLASNIQVRAVRCCEAQRL